MATTDDETAMDAHPYSPRQAYVLLAFIAGMTLCLELARVPIVVLVDPIRTTFRIDDVQVSLLFGAASSVPFVAMSVIGGWLTDRSSRKPLLLMAVIVWVTGALISASAGRFEMLVAGRVLLGAGAGMKLPIAMAWINDAFPPVRRGRAIGAFFVVLGSAPSLAITLAGVAQHAALTGRFAWIGHVVGHEPWRATLAVLALPSLAMLLLVPFLRDARVDAAPHGVSATSERMRIGVMALIVGGAALNALVDSANLSWVSTIFIRNFRFDPQRAAAVFGVATLIAGLAGPLLGGALGDRMFRRHGGWARVMLAGVATLVCAPLLGSYMLGSASVLVVALTLSGVCTVTTLSLSYVSVQAVLPPRTRGLGTGIMSASTTLIGSTGPTLVALTSERLFAARPGGLIDALSVVAGTAAVAAGVLLILSALALRHQSAVHASGRREIGRDRGGRDTVATNPAA